MKNIWPVALILFFVAVFAAVISFVFFTQRNRVDLVAPDYYAQSLTHEDYLDSVRRAQQFTNGPILTAQGAAVQISIPNFEGATGALELYRPSRAKLDERRELALDDQGRQQVDLSGLERGLWRLRLHWTVSNQSFAVETSTVL